MFGSQWYMKAGNWGYNLIMLNMLWFLFSFLGLFVLGLFPATAALFAVLREAIVEPDDISVFKQYWKKFKAEFVRANLIGYLFLVAGLILYVDLKVIQQLNNYYLYLASSSVLFIISIIYLITLLYIFPVFVHFNLKLWEYPKHAIILAVGRPLITLIMIVGVLIILYLYAHVPVLIPIFGMSLIGFILMKIALLALPKKEHLSCAE